MSASSSLVVGASSDTRLAEINCKAEYLVLTIFCVQGTNLGTEFVDHMTRLTWESIGLGRLGQFLQRYIGPR